MRYILTQKFLSFGDSFVVQDEAGRNVYRVDAKFLAFGHKLVVSDMRGDERALIRRKMWTFGHQYLILMDGAERALVKQAFGSFLRSRFRVDVVGGAPLRVTGNIMGHEYRITRGRRHIATISKKWFAFTDTYGVDIADGEDDLLLLAVAVVIDLVCHKSSGLGMG